MFEYLWYLSIDSTTALPIWGLGPPLPIPFPDNKLWECISDLVEALTTFRFLSHESSGLIGKTSSQYFFLNRLYFSVILSSQQN